MLEGSLEGAAAAVNLAEVAMGTRAVLTVESKEAVVEAVVTVVLAWAKTRVAGEVRADPSAVG
jgi:hypothetical protein